MTSSGPSSGGTTPSARKKAARSGGSGAQHAVDHAVEKCDIPALQKAVSHASNLLVAIWTRDAAKAAFDMAKASKDLHDELREKESDKPKALNSFFNEVIGAVNDIIKSAGQTHKDFQKIYDALDRAQMLCGKLKPSHKLGAQHMSFHRTLRLHFNHGLVNGLDTPRPLGESIIPTLPDIGSIHIPGMHHIPGAQPLIPRPLLISHGSVMATAI